MINCCHYVQECCNKACTEAVQIRFCFRVNIRLQVECATQTVLKLVDLVT